MYTDDSWVTRSGWVREGADGVDDVTSTVTHCRDGREHRVRWRDGEGSEGSEVDAMRSEEVEVECTTDGLNPPPVGVGRTNDDVEAENVRSRS